MQTVGAFPVQCSPPTVDENSRYTPEAPILKFLQSPLQTQDVRHEILKLTSSRQSAPGEEPMYFLPQVDEYFRACARAEKLASSQEITFNVAEWLQSLRKYSTEVDPVSASWASMCLEFSTEHAR